MKMKSIYTLALLATTAVLALTGSPVQASEADDALTASINDSHVFKTFLNEDDITTTANAGVVTLTGTVADASHKALAEDTATAVAGVKSVDNQLTIKENDAQASEDWWTTFKVKNLLRFHRNVSAAATEVDTTNGIVTLTGEATSIAQKELSTEYAMDIDGVKSVQNNMTIAAVPAAAPLAEQTIAEKLDDASITAQTKAALLAHRSTSALTTKVNTRDGIVTVTGIAKNEAEKTLVTKLVNDINGVKQVINSMTLAPAATSQM